jgi:hypothetical protein
VRLAGQDRNEVSEPVRLGRERAPSTLSGGSDLEALFELGLDLMLRGVSAG